MLFRSCEAAGFLGGEGVKVFKAATGQNILDPGKTVGVFAVGFEEAGEAHVGLGPDRHRDMAAFGGRHDTAPRRVEDSGGVDAGNPAAVQTAHLYTRLLGSVLGNLALTHLPYGGIFLIGGMSRAMTPYLAPMGLADAICDKGRFGTFLRAFPVWVVEDDFAALTGCAAYLANGGQG